MHSVSYFIVTDGELVHVATYLNAIDEPAIAEFSKEENDSGEKPSTLYRVDLPMGIVTPLAFWVDGEFNESKD